MTLKCCRLLSKFALAAILLTASLPAFAQQAVPQPIRNQGFAQQLNRSDVRNVQAFERVGKQFFPSQPTGQTTLRRNSQSSKSPWLQRFIKPRKSDAERNQSSSLPSVAGTQPPLQNIGSSVQRRTNVAQPVPTGRPPVRIGSNSNRPAFLTEQNRTGYDVGSRYSSSSPAQPTPTETSTARLGVGALRGFETKELPKTGPTATRTSRPIEPDATARVARTPATPKVEMPQANVAPKVSRIRPPSRTPPVEPKIITPKPAKAKPTVSPQVTSRTVSVPTKLVNTPKSKNAALLESNTRPPALFLATQIQRRKAGVEEKPKKPETPIELELPEIPSLPSITKPGITKPKAPKASKLTMSPPAAKTEVKKAEPESVSLPLPEAPKRPAPKAPEVVKPKVKQSVAPRVEPKVVKKEEPKPKPRKMPPVAPPKTTLVTKPQPKPQQPTQPAESIEPSGFAHFAATPQRSPYKRAANERLQTHAPHMRVVLNGPNNVPVNVPADFEVVVINEDRLELQGMVLRVEVPRGVAVQPGRPDLGQFDIETAPDGATLLVWQIDRLSGGRMAKAPVRMAAKSAKDFNVGLDWTLVPLSRSASVHVISPQIELAIAGPEDVLFGDTNAYRLRVRNNGDAVAENVAVEVVAGEFGSSSSKIGKIAPGAEETMEIDLSFKKRGTIRLNASAGGSNSGRSQAGMDVMVRKPELVTTLSAPQMVYHGTAVNYTATILNKGDATADRVTGFLRLPPGAQPVSLPYGATQEGHGLKWPISKLEPSAQKEYKFQISLPNEGENKVALECLGRAVSTEAKIASTTVQAIPDLKLLVSDPVAPAPVGSEVNYELILTNRGSKAAYNVQVVAWFSKGIEPTRSGGHGYRVVPGKVFFDPIGTVGAGQTVRLQVYAIAEGEGMHRFRAEVRTDDEDIRLVQEESTQYLQTGATQTMRLATPAEASPLR